MCRGLRRDAGLGCLQGVPSMTASQFNVFNWRAFPRPSIFAMDAAFSGGQQGGVGVKAAIKQHNATRSKTSSINTAAADKQKAALV